MTYNIVCTIGGNYAPHFATMCTSIFENNKGAPFKIHLIVDKLDDRDLEKIKKLFKKYRQKFEICYVDRKQFQGFPLSAHASTSNYYRIILTDLLPIDLEKVVYLDCDLIVDGGITNLWEIDINNKAVIACGRYHAERIKTLGLSGLYFNSGVMVVNLTYWRENNVKNRVINFIKKNPDLIEFWDQDAFNAVLQNEWLPLEQIYNFTSDLHTSPGGIKPRIIHFTGMHKPWNAHCQHQLKWKYHKYRRMSTFNETRFESVLLRLSGLLKRLISKIRNISEAGKKKPSVPTKKTEYCGKTLLSAENGNNWIGHQLKENKPFFVGRIGSTELSCLCYYHQILAFDDSQYHKMKTNMNIASGFFPSTDKFLQKFAQTYVEDALSKADMIGVWFNKGEEAFLNGFSNNIEFCELAGLEPYYHSQPWSKYLEGKKVLVVHPFDGSIKRQYEIKEKIFPENNCLPNFELKTIKAIQTIAGNKSEHETWFHALDQMKQQILQEEFDLAIIGAGAYGFHLGGFVKSLGKSAIHLGGATQILFGIRGKRWEENKKISPFFNEYWITPSTEEKPEGANLVENGCYW